ncbi:AAA family ATPase [Rhizobium rhizosphaerae]|uniref:AAA family ATPase n=1 Tax=Xaviernesmea rhizosphaerae TaxID=1672749 RepID=UPI00094FD881|nr:AAA family ATPase [Xaviernesmea rhizosphaerae]
MQENLLLTGFRIINLNERLNVDLIIENNTLILVGENGTGKTTILRIMFYFLSGRFIELSKFRFEEIKAYFGTKEVSVKLEDISVPFLASSDIARVPPSMRNRWRSLQAEGKYDELLVLAERIFPRSYREQMTMFESQTSENLADLQVDIVKTMNAQILYLPTYRRIERELTSIYSGIDPDDLRRNRSAGQSDTDDAYIELVEFGMADVKRAIDTALQRISAFANAGLNTLTLGYLGEVVNQDYRTTQMPEIATASPETVSAVLDRVGTTILNEGQKRHLREIITKAKLNASAPTEHEQIIFHYFSKLLRFQSELQEKERSITAFCELCSTYIRDKKFVYDAQTFSFRIDWVGGQILEAGRGKKNHGDVALSDLSSGEKQIVSLFSHLYLAGRERFFVLIDEPELSLSVPWQRRFLQDIRDGEFCSGLIAVTHSPFIYDNALRKSTHALGEFISGPDWGNI